VLSTLTETLRLLGRRWPQLLAWFLAGWLARYLLIELAAYAASTFALAGLLIMPLAILARLVSFVAMFLVLRDDMPSLRRVAADPLPQTGAERRAAFLDAVLVSILPFFAFYYAWGLLKADMDEYARRAIDVYTFHAGEFLDPDRLSYTEMSELRFDILTVGIIVLAFAGRWALKRWRANLPKWTSIVGVYLEAVWVFMSVFLISGLLGSFSSWVESRQAMVWLADAREWLAQFAAPLAWIWDAVLWAVGEVGGLILQPLAWLAIAGVIYGRAVAARRVALPIGERADAVRLRYSKISTRVRRRLGDFWVDLTGRFRPIGRAFALIWQAGAIPMGVFILSYTVVIALQGWLSWGLTRVIGPHDLDDFWLLIDSLLVLTVAVLTEPLRIAVVAAAYDHALGALAPREQAMQEAPVEDAAGAPDQDSGSEPTSIAT
jgi:hypothetical protein